MSATHNIPTYSDPNRGHVGHFRSDATLIVEGSSSAGGPGGWFVGGWDQTGEGRIEFEGPMVKGPYAFITGLPSVIARDGGTAASWRWAEAAGLLFRVKAGDTLVLAGMEFTLTVDARGYPHLHPTAR